MPRLLFIGDTHGDLGRTRDMIDLAVRLNCVEIIQAGDWGFIWPDIRGNIRPEPLVALSNYLRANGIRMRFVDGNHDVHPTLFALPRDSERTDQDPEKDNCAPYIVYQHRGSLHKYEDGTRIVFLGGAPSIDYRGRIEGISWWKEEQITDADVNAACAHQGEKIHVLVTHDSATPPPGVKESSDTTFMFRARDSLSKVRRVMDCLKPDFHIHGHYHLRYTGSYNNTCVEGLDCNLFDPDQMWYLYEPDHD